MDGALAAPAVSRIPGEDSVMTDPFGGGFGGFDPSMFSNVPLFRELAKVMSWRGGPVNWDLAAQTATGIAEAEAEQPVGDRESDEFAAAVATAELWLDQVTELPAVKGLVGHLSRLAWTSRAATASGLGAYVEPIAAGAAAQLAGNLPEELSGMLGNLGMDAGAGNPLAQAMQSMGAMLYGMQTGTIVGHLAGQLLGTYDLGVPAIDPATIGPVGDSAVRFATDYDVEPAELRHWLALSETAHRRIYAGVPWLRDELAGLIRRFAEEADAGAQSMFDQLGGMGVDPADPTSLQRALEAPDAFRHEPSAGQQQVTRRLQALVSFTEAWVDTVVRAAAGDKLTALPRIEEAIRRRRAEQGPGERFLTQLIGLDLTPADIRLAQDFCAAVIAARGQDGLDRVWRAAANLPTPDELAEPSHWLVRMAAAELEAGETG
jgi:putative hydrolase